MAGRGFHITRKQKFILTIVISACFFVAELGIGFKTHSLALIADAFHYLNDLISFIVALVAEIVSERSSSPKALSFGWQRVKLLGGFFNGVFLVALGISIFLQSVERFIHLERVQQPLLVLIVGGVGLALNIITILFLHDHDHDHGHGHGHSHGDDDVSHEHGHEHAHQHNHGHEHSSTGVSGTEVDRTELKARRAEEGREPGVRHHEHRHLEKAFSAPGRDLGLMGVILHVIGDAINNIGVIISAVVIWKAPGEGRFYADPAASCFIAFMILATAIPLLRSCGSILLQSAPIDVNLDDVKHDLEKIPGIESLHELHVWRLDERKTIASVHVVVSDKSVPNFIKTAKYINECLHAYGIHSATLQPELARPSSTSADSTIVASTTSVADAASTTSARKRPTVAAQAAAVQEGCQLICTGLCESLMCCNFR